MKEKSHLSFDSILNEVKCDKLEEEIFELEEELKDDLDANETLSEMLDDAFKDEDTLLEDLLVGDDNE